MHKNQHRLSVIISVMNALPMTKMCIGCLRENISADNTEIIVVDNASTDGTAEWLKEQADIQVITNEEPHSLSASFNQGLAASAGEEILYMHNDTFLMPETVAHLEKILYQHDNTGAVMPVTNNHVLPINRFFHEIAEYNTLGGAKKEAGKLWKNWGAETSGQLFLEDYCLLTKREAIEMIGGFDERFAVRYGEDFDLSLRLVQAGWKLLRAEGIYVHHQQGETFKANQLNRDKTIDMFIKMLYDKWGFFVLYSGGVRRDLLSEVDLSKKELALLDIGCGMGANFAYLQHLRPDAKLCGIEINPLTAAFAAKYGEVKAADVERLNIPEWEGTFDYIIMGDILEHLREPKDVIIKVKKLLKPNGVLLVSLPNVMNVEVVFNLLAGGWHYEDAGILDRTHLRFFTRREMEAMFIEAGYSFEIFGGSRSFIPERGEAFLAELQKLQTVKVDIEQMRYVQYFIKAIPV